MKFVRGIMESENYNVNNFDNKAIKESNRRISVCKIIIIVIVALMVCFGSFFAGYFFRSGTYQKETNTIDYIIKMMRKHYYYEEGTDYVELFDNAVLDRYSEFYTKEEYKAIKQNSVGAREGIGLSVTSDKAIVKVAWNSPCDRSGIRIGGVIVGIKTSTFEKTISADDNLDAIINEIPANTDFTLQISYNGGEKQDFVIKREFYTETFARYYDDNGEYGCQTNQKGEMKFLRVGDNVDYDLEGKTDVGVINFRSFNGLNKGLNGASGQIAESMKQFSKNGKHNLIIDLRNNGGGYLDVLREISAHFIGAEYGKEVAVISEIDKYKNVKTHKSSSVVSRDYAFKSITVIVDEGSASASEAFVGALLDYDSQNIVKVVIEENERQSGVYRSYGKGIMQTTFENFVEGSAIKLTTAQLFWPKSNVCIHGVGITEALNGEPSFNGVKKVYNESASGCVHDAVSFSK